MAYVLDPLYEASKDGNVTLVNELLSGGAEVNTRTPFGHTPLHAASQNEYIEVVEILLAAGADVNVPNHSDDMPLHFASDIGNQAIVNMLLDKGAAINVQNDLGFTPLHTALEERNFDVVKSLLARGADVNVQTNFDNTPLHFASCYGNIPIVEMLLARGAGINVTNIKGATALHMAVRGCQFHNSIVTMLLRNGAEVNAKDNEGQTPLNWALNCWDIHPSSILELNDWGGIFTLHPPQSCLHEPLAVIHNYIQWNCAGIKLKTENEDFLNHYLSQPHCVFLLKSFSCELEKLKAKKFGNFCLYDVFSKRNEPMLWSNMDMEQFVISPFFESEFPIYGLVLRAVFVKYKQNLDILKWILQGVGVHLPEEMVRLILSYM